MTREEPAFLARQRSIWWRVYRMPLLLAAATALGLISALLGDGVWNALSWGALAVPLSTILWFAGKPR